MYKRQVIDTGKADPSRESREHLLRYEDGLLNRSRAKRPVNVCLHIAVFS